MLKIFRGTAIVLCRRQTTIQASFIYLYGSSMYATLKKNITVTYMDSVLYNSFFIWQILICYKWHSFIIHGFILSTWLEKSCSSQIIERNLEGTVGAIHKYLFTNVANVFNMPPLTRGMYSFSVWSEPNIDLCLIIDMYPLGPLNTLFHYLSTNCSSSFFLSDLYWT